MKIRLHYRIQSAKGVFSAGDVVDWPAKDANPLLEGGLATEYRPEIVPEADVLLATNVSNLDEMLGNMDDADVIEQARDQDYRSTAKPKYDARLAELEDEGG